ncbi:MAG TPA: NEAT domain-containing protein [Bacillota bacterium]|nr:NEAT domain-containing protein [Bacillota bacterium]
MKKLSCKTIFIGLALIISLIALPAGSVFAAYADGTYQISYEIKEAGNDNASIADGYFSKPATLTIQDGAQYIQLTLTNSDMIKSLSVEGTPVEVVSDSGDTRVVKFKVSGDLTQPVNMEMHVVVPDLYDTTHGARAVFDVSNVPAQEANGGGGEATEDSSNETGTADGEPVDNPPTGDETPIAMYIALLVGSIAVFALYKFRFARN